MLCLNLSEGQEATQITLTVPYNGTFAYNQKIPEKSKKIYEKSKKNTEKSKKEGQDSFPYNGTFAYNGTFLYNPYNGTLSLPVQNTKNAFLSSNERPFNIYHRFLNYKIFYLITVEFLVYPS